MLNTIHYVSAVVLLIAHSLFLGSGIYISLKKLKPRLIDWAARLTAQIALGTVIITGLILLPIRPIPFFPHVLTGLLPLFSIPTVQIVRIIVKKRKALPWILPVINLVLIIIAFITGIIIMK